jgi:putative addiction module component (TIGR02574 family)
MSTDLGEITTAALALPEAERAELLGRLMESLDGAADPDADREWADEIARRLAEVRSGTAQTSSWADVRKRLAEDADGDAG